MSESIRVLVVDDDEAHAETVAEVLEARDYDVVVAHGGRQAQEILRREEFDVVLTDLLMADVDGLGVLAASKAEQPEAEVVILTGHNSIETAVAAMQAGAATYLTKPLDVEELRIVVEKRSESRKLARMNAELRKRLDERFGFEGVVGNSPEMRRVVDRLRQVAPTVATVLITGESGTGKELAAKAIHQNSPRAGKPYVALNCAALSENILESELFGHVKGSFTGAERDRKGYFEQASGGTLFLDEVGDIPVSTQVKLLRTLESGEVTRVGTHEPTKVNVRLVSATNRDLTDSIAAGKFREDLYHRLKVVSIRMPALRSHREDIPLLIEHFLREFAAAHSKKLSGISPAARRALQAHDWPGNVRELRNVIESMIVMDLDGLLDLDDLPDEFQSAGDSPIASSRTASSGVSDLVGQSLDAIERHYIAATLNLTGGNREEAARRLGIGERTLYRKIKDYGLN